MRVTPPCDAGARNMSGPGSFFSGIAGVNRPSRMILGPLQAMTIPARIYASRRRSWEWGLAPWVAGRCRPKLLGRVDPLPGRRQVRRRAPADRVALEVEPRQPDPAQDLDG